MAIASSDNDQYGAKHHRLLVESHRTARAGGVRRRCATGARGSLVMAMAAGIAAITTATLGGPGSAALSAAAAAAAGVAGATPATAPTTPTAPVG